MDINEKCAKFIESLNGFSTSLTLRYTSRQVNFVSLRPGINPDNIYSIGYVETVTEEEETGTLVYLQRSFRVQWELNKIMNKTKNRILFLI